MLEETIMYSAQVFIVTISFHHILIPQFKSIACNFLCYMAMKNSCFQKTFLIQIDDGCNRVFLCVPSIRPKLNSGAAALHNVRWLLFVLHHTLRHALFLDHSRGWFSLPTQRRSLNSFQKLNFTERGQTARSVHVQAQLDLTKP